MIHTISVLIALCASAVAWMLISYSKNKEESAHALLYIPIQEESEEKNIR